MPAIYLHEHTVTEDEVDGQGHVNNLVYMHWMIEAALEHSSAQGWTPERYQREGIGWVAKSHRIEYIKPAFVGEPIVVRTWVSGFKRVSSVRRYRILRSSDDAVLAIAETNWAFVTLKTGMPRRIPPEVSQAFVIVVDELLPPDRGST